MYNLSDTEFSFDIQNQDETEMVMHLFGEYLCTEMEEERANLVRRIGFQGHGETGKSIAINALFQTLGDIEVYEEVEANTRRQQQLMWSDRAGWIRHYDASFIGNTQRSLPSASDIYIWEHTDPTKEIQDLAVGLDIVEHPDNKKEKNQDFDFIVKLEGESVNSEYEPFYVNKRTLTFAAKQEYIEDPHFVAFIHLVQPALDNHRIAKAEHQVQFDPV